MRLHAELDDVDELLTPREGQILPMLCEGLQRKQIAARLDRAENTVNNQIETLYAKLGTHNVSQTIALAVARGLIRISTLCLVYALCLSAVDLDLDARRPPSRIARVRSVRTREALV